MSGVLEFAWWGKEPPHAKQREVWDRRLELLAPGGPRQLLLSWGPQAGKDRLSTRIVGDLGYRLLKARRDDPNAKPLVPPVNCWVVAPTSDDYAQVWNEFVTLLRPLSPIIRRAKGNEAFILEADPERPEATGLWIKFKTGWDEDRMVAEGVDILYVTEAAKLPTPTYDLARARTASAGRAGIEVLNGTPTETPAEYYRTLYRRGEAGEDGLIWSCMASWENPTLEDEQLRKLLAIQRDTSERRWLANWGARLLPEGAGLFRRLGDVATGAIEPYQLGARYVHAYDPARTGDYNVHGVWRIDGDHAGCPKQVMLDRWHGEWERSKVIVARHMSEYPSGEFHYDATGRISMRKELREMAPSGLRVYPVEWTAKLKASMVDHAIRTVELAGCQLLSGDSCDAARAQVNELLDFTAKKTPTGEKYEAPDGGHDDTVAQVIMALWATRGATRETFYEAAARLGIG